MIDDIENIIRDLVLVVIIILSLGFAAFHFIGHSEINDYTKLNNIPKEIQPIIDECMQDNKITNNEYSNKILRAYNQYQKDQFEKSMQ